MESQATGFMHFRLMYGAKAMTPQELRHGSPQSDPDTFLDIDEMTTKDLLDGNQVYALNALNKYQAVTKARGTKSSFQKNSKRGTSFYSEQRGQN